MGLPENLKKQLFKSRRESNQTSAALPPGSKTHVFADLPNLFGAANSLNIFLNHVFGSFLNCFIKTMGTEANEELKALSDPDSGFSPYFQAIEDVYRSKTSKTQNNDTKTQQYQSIFEKYFNGTFYGAFDGASSNLLFFAAFLPIVLILFDFQV